MHIIFCTLALLLCSISAIAQNNHQPGPITVLGYPLGFQNDTVNFQNKQHSFYLGWHWGGKKPASVISKRLHINAIQGGWSGTGTIGGSANYPDSSSLSLILQAPDNLTFGSRYYRYEYSAAVYDPCFTGSYADTTRWVHGFGSRTGDTVSVPGGGKRFVPSGNGTVLSGVSPKNILRWLYKDITNNRDMFLDTNNSGGRYYLSINLRRMDANDNAMNNDTVLKVKLKYKIQDTAFAGVTFSIMFDSVSGTGSTPLTNRGGALSGTLAAPTSQTRELVITRNMLPEGNNSNKDITLHAFFRVDSLVGQQDTSIANKIITANRVYGDSINHPLEWEGNGDTSLLRYQIKELDVEVINTGSSVVGINYVRIATPLTKQLAEGGIDSVLRSEVKKVLDTLQTVRAAVASRGITVKLHSLYAYDEPVERLWYAQRLLHYLLGGRLSTENDKFKDQDVEAYTEGTRIRAPWGSVRLYGNYSTSVAAPYIKYGSQSRNTAYIHRGRLMSVGDQNNAAIASGNDKRGSQYEETSRKNNSTWITWTDSARYASLQSMDLATLYNSEFVGTNYLGMSEGSRYSIFYKNSAYLYDTAQAWWNNIWLLSEPWYARRRNNDNGELSVDVQRPKTGEEIRADIWVSLIMGSKGLFYDRMYTNEFDNKACGARLCPGEAFGNPYQLGAISGDGKQSACLNLPDPLLCEQFGGDYIAWDSTTAPVDPTQFDLFINMQHFATSMGVAPDKIYLGRKSVRLEVAKINARIAQMGDTLMQMRLVAWHGKGVRTLRNGDTTKLGSILAMNKISTLRKHNIYGGQYPSQLEKPWEQFYDITLHRLANKPIDSAFVVGIMNRRTNPLLGREGATGDDAIRFISTADFDAMVDSNASQYYAQGGARSITLPFTYSPEVNGQQRSVLLRIREMGCVAGKPCIDTVISGTRDLTVHLQPGEGKLLYVQVLGYDTKEIIGDLRYTNQRKIVAEPRGSDTVVYHAVYQREVQKPYPHTEVFYRRSVPTHISKPHASGIEWEPFEAQLSDTVLSLITFHSTPMNQINAQNSLNFDNRDSGKIANLECGYPSIVVRNSMVHVVFSCLDYEFPTEDPANSNFISTYYMPHDTILNTVVILESVFPSNLGKAYYLTQENVRGEKRHATRPRYWSSPNTSKPLHPSTSDRTHPRFNLENWGTPMIGARSNGDIYYTWSDSLAGIGVSAGNWDSSAITHLKHSFGLAQHPSIPSYIDESPILHPGTSVVWQETTPLSQMKQIFYAHVQKDDTGKVSKKQFPTHVTGQMNYDTYPNLYPIDWGINSDSTIIRLSDDTCKVSNTHPIVIRALEQGSDIVGFDIVAWTAESIEGKKNVLQRSVAYSEYVLSRGVSVPLPWLDIGPRRTYLGKQDQSEGVNLSNGSGVGTITTYSSSFVHSSQTVTSTRVRFPSNTKAYTIGLRESSTMWQIEYPYHSLLYRLEGDEPYIGLNDLPSPRKTIETGFHNNLSAFPEKNMQYSIGRRLYNKQEINIASNSIHSSAQYFLRNTLTDPIAIPVAELRVINPIVRCEWTRVLVTLKKSTEPILLALVTDAKGVHTDSLNQGVLLPSSDTVASLGFELEHGEEFNILSAEEGTPGIQAELVRDSDGQRFPLTLEKGDENSYIQNTYISYLRTDTYHLEFFAQEGKVVPSEAIELEGVQLANGSTFPIGLYKGSESGGNNPRQILLPSDGSGAKHEVQTYPNPTNDILYFTVREDYRGGEYRLLNSLGVTVLRGEVVPGTSAQQISVREIPSGVYYLHIEATNKTGTVPLRGKVLIRK